MRLLPALVLAFLATVASAQQAYRWIGKDGKVHYSDAPPPADAQKAEQKQFSASVVGGDRLPYEARKAAQDFPVTLFAPKTCDDACLSARSFLARRGIPYTEKTVVTADDVAALRQATGADTVPSLRVGREAAKGFEEGAWGSLLDAAGYPAAR